MDFYFHEEAEAELIAAIGLLRKERERPGD